MRGNSWICIALVRLWKQCCILSATSGGKMCATMLRLKHPNHISKCSGSSDTAHGQPEADLQAAWADSPSSRWRLLQRVRCGSGHGMEESRGHSKKAPRSERMPPLFPLRSGSFRSPPCHPPSPATVFPPPWAAGRGSHGHWSPWRHSPGRPRASRSPRWAAAPPAAPGRGQLPQDPLQPVPFAHDPGRHRNGSPRCESADVAASGSMQERLWTSPTSRKRALKVGLCLSRPRRAPRRWASCQQGRSPSIWLFGPYRQDRYS
mmetsp:Transcript_31561/g.52062  ORF Transcript_31561/g.52062 Transcript_31561/m.52062 type:complete len:262 (+) Transcript_31561:438-1223(+)